MSLWKWQMLCLDPSPKTEVQASSGSQGSPELWGQGSHPNLRSSSGTGIEEGDPQGIPGRLDGPVCLKQSQCTVPCLSPDSIQVPFPVFTLVPVFGKSPTSAPPPFPLWQPFTSLLPNKAGFLRPPGAALITPVSHLPLLWLLWPIPSRAQPAALLLPSQSPIVHGFHGHSSAPATSAQPLHHSPRVSPQYHPEAPSHPPALSLSCTCPAIPRPVHTQRPHLWFTLSLLHGSSHPTSWLQPTNLSTQTSWKPAHLGAWAQVGTEIPPFYPVPSPQCPCTAETWPVLVSPSPGLPLPGLLEWSP